MMMPPKETLVLPQGEAITWNEFDTGWYRRVHSQGRDVQDALEEYLTVGQASGHSPNMFFDEAWYRRRNPDVAEAVQAGHFSSGFDHYCRAGFRTRSPHWLFDVSYYEAGSPDLTADSLTAGGFLNAYDHFLRVGSSEGRIAHPLFESSQYRAQLASSGGGPGDDPCPFVHYLRQIHTGQAAIATSLYFDAAWYAAVYPQATDPAAAFLSSLHHYLCNDTPAEFDPLPDFSEKHYLTLYPDVAQAVEARIFTHGYMHFLRVIAHT